jgi:CRISPR/Cas system-associated endonuclease Cas1
MMALACDLEEEFRHLIDSTVLYMINRGMAKPAEFIYDKKIHHKQLQSELDEVDSVYPCLMKQDLKKAFIDHVEKRLCASITIEDGKKQVSYIELFSLQAEQVKQLIYERNSEYIPLRIR